MSAITLTTPTLDLTAGFERLLAPFARVDFLRTSSGMIMGIALRFMPQFGHRDEADGRCTGEPRCARDGRPARRRAYARQCGDSAVYGRVSSCRNAVCRHGCRCYHGEQGRTRLHAPAFGRGDALAVVVTALLLICVIVINLQLV